MLGIIQPVALKDTDLKEEEIRDSTKGKEAAWCAVAFPWAQIGQLQDRE